MLPMRVCFRLPRFLERPSRSPGFVRNRLLNFANDDILPAVISSPTLARKTILPFRILKRSSDRSAKALRCTQSPCAPLIVGFPFPFARPRAGRFHRNFLRRSGARPARTLRCSRCPCAPRIAELVSILRYSAQMGQRLVDLVPRFEKGTSIWLASQLLQRLLQPRLRNSSFDPARLAM